MVALPPAQLNVTLVEEAKVDPGAGLTICAGVGLGVGVGAGVGLAAGKAMLSKWMGIEFQATPHPGVGYS